MLRWEKIIIRNNNESIISMNSLIGQGCPLDKSRIVIMLYVYSFKLFDMEWKKTSAKLKAANQVVSELSNVRFENAAFFTSLKSKLNEGIKRFDSIDFDKLQNDINSIESAKNIYERSSGLEVPAELRAAADRLVATCKAIN